MEIIIDDIDNGKSFDWGRTSEDYAKFRDIYPEIFYEKIIGMGLCIKRQRVLDIGTGTGVLPRNLYKYGAEFIGSDISENQIVQARFLSDEAGMDISEESEIAANSERLILKYNPSWSAHSQKRFTYDFPNEAHGLFEIDDSFIYDVPITFTRESWHGRMKACRGIGASSLPAEKIAEFEEEHIGYLTSVPEIFEIPHFVTIMNLRKSVKPD